MSQLDSLRQAVSVSPNNVPLLLLLAQALVDDFSHDEARDVYARILKADPANTAARRGLARALYLMGKVSEAIVRMEALVGEIPGDADSWLFLSQMHLGEKDTEAAASCYEKAVQLKPVLKDASFETKLFGQSPVRPAAPPPGPKIPVTAQGLGEDGEEPSAQDVLDQIEKPNITFKDVGGMTACKEEIRMKIMYPLQNPDLFKAYGKKAGGGVLLYGPPGCGKTLLSRATAGEIKAEFLSIGIHQILDLYLGNSEKNMHRIFELARDHAPCVLFFDEVDALAADRNDLRKSAGRTLINQFLAEMDGNVGSNEGVLILGATNAPWHIDPAFRRPGRFDRVLFVPPPDESARASIIDVMARHKPVSDIDVPLIAKKAKDLSGADIKALFDQATEHCLSIAMKENRVIPITTDILLRTLKTITPSTRTWFESAKNYAIYSNRGGFYNDVLKYLGLLKE